MRVANLPKAGPMMLATDTRHAWRYHDCTPHICVTRWGAPHRVRAAA
jgi:hypothetical protein